jgi:hypothetical protein
MDLIGRGIEHCALLYVGWLVGWLVQSYPCCFFIHSVFFILCQSHSHSEIDEFTNKLMEFPYTLDLL